MLSGGRCSIYEHRPLTCRTYDCRVFPAAGIAADRDLITRRTRRWKFGHPAEDDHVQHAAVQAAARFARERAECFPGGAAPRELVEVALFAVKVCEVFLGSGDAPGVRASAPSDRDLARTVMEVNERFAAAWAAAPAPPGGPRRGAHVAGGRDLRPAGPDG